VRVRTSALVAVIACGSPPLSDPCPAIADPLLVDTSSGPVHGKRDGGALAWLGIPYAAPPTGDRRWRPPAPVATWSSVRDATGFGDACVQAGSPAAPDATALGSEDCLTLNVWRPASDARPRPVVVFIHGGYFAWGASSWRERGVDVYDGRRLAVAADVVVVTMNYRLGAFGFLALPGLAAEDAYGSTGDYGLADQLAALRWIQRDIAAFGGDASRVTLAGQSAGATSSLLVALSPLSRGLVHRVAMLSGNTDVAPLAVAERTGDRLARAVDCRGSTEAVVACLRGKSAPAIASALPRSFAPGGAAFAPVIDGHIVPRAPLDALARGESADIPLLVSTTHAEFSTMIDHFTQGPLATADDYAAQLRARFGAAAPALLAAYPAAAYESPRAALIAVLTDLGFACPSDAIADEAATHRSSPVYRFEYDRAYAGPVAKYGAGHALDVLMVFGELPPYVSFRDSDRALAGELVAAWSRFARAGELAWPRRTLAGQERTVLDDAIHPATGDRARCGVWRELVGRQTRRI
jgi:para-nitrobenzyl esterase